MWCVRAARAAGESARAAEIVRVRSNGEYPSAAVGIWIRYSPQIVYNHRASAPAPRAARLAPQHRLSDARRPSNGPSLHLPFDLPLQAVAHEQVANNRILCTSYGMGFLLCKTSDRGGRGFDLVLRRRRRRIRPLRLFFANWPPSRLPYTCSLPYRAHGSVCTRCAAGCNRRVSVGRRVVRATRLAGPCWA